MDSGGILFFHNSGEILHQSIRTFSDTGLLSVVRFGYSFTDFQNAGHVDSTTQMYYLPLHW